MKKNRFENVAKQILDWVAKNGHLFKTGEAKELWKEFTSIFNSFRLKTVTPQEAETAAARLLQVALLLTLLSRAPKMKALAMILQTSNAVEKLAPHLAKLLLKGFELAPIQIDKAKQSISQLKTSVKKAAGKIRKKKTDEVESLPLKKS